MWARSTRRASRPCWMNVAKGFEKKMEEEGAKFTTLPADERKKWATMMPNIAKNWVERNVEARGLPAKKVPAAYMQKLRDAKVSLVRECGIRNRRTAWPGDQRRAGRSVRSARGGPSRACCSSSIPLVAAWIFVLMVVINVDVIGRTLFTKPLPGVPELVRLSIVAIVFLQIGSTLRAGRG